MESNSKRSLTVLAVVVACFAILWPKIFYPMILSIVFPVESEEEVQDKIKRLNFESMLHPQMIEAMGESRPVEKTKKEGNRALFHPSLRYMTKPHSKGAGAINFVIPVYTIAIIIFFIYALLKTVFKSRPETIHSYSSNQQKILSSLKPLDLEETSKRKENPQERKTQHALEQYGKEKVLAALKTIILEMEDFNGNLSEDDVVENSVPDTGGTLHGEHMALKT